MYLKMLLGLVVGVFLVIAWRGERSFRRLKESSGKQKIAIYQMWLVGSFLSLGVLGTWIIYYLGLFGERANGGETLTLYPPYNLIYGAIRPYINSDNSQIYPAILGLFTGIIAVFIFARTRRGRRFYNTEVISTLQPTTRTEAVYLILLCVNAGLSEEIMFRGALPALLFAVTHNALASLIVPCIVFGCVHWYQGARGVISTFGVGLVFSAILTAGFGLYVVIVLHALFDIVALFLIPRAFNNGRSIRPS